MPIDKELIGHQLKTAILLKSSLENLDYSKK